MNKYEDYKRKEKIELILKDVDTKCQFFENLMREHHVHTPKKTTTQKGTTNPSQNTGTIIDRRPLYNYIDELRDVTSFEKLFCKKLDKEFKEKLKVLTYKFRECVVICSRTCSSFNDVEVIYIINYLRDFRRLLNMKNMLDKISNIDSDLCSYLKDNVTQSLEFIRETTGIHGVEDIGNEKDAVTIPKSVVEDGDEEKPITKTKKPITKGTEKEETKKKTSTGKEQKRKEILQGIGERQWLSVDEVCVKFNLPKSNIKSRKWRLDNGFPMGNDGPYSHITFHSKDVEEWLKKRK